MDIIAFKSTDESRNDNEIQQMIATFPVAHIPRKSKPTKRKKAPLPPCSFLSRTEGGQSRVLFRGVKGKRERMEEGFRKEGCRVEDITESGREANWTGGI